MKRLLISIGLLALYLNGCARSFRSQAPNPNRSSQNNPQISQLINDTAPAANSDPIYVAMGGWNSCVVDSRIPNEPSPYGMNMNKEFSKFLERIEARFPGRKAKFVMSCHSADVSRVRYVVSSDPFRMIITGHDEYYAAINNFAQQTNSSLVMMGHSYGGSQIMQAVQRLAPQVRVPSLITIDPISPTTCPPAVMVNLLATRVKQLFGQNGSSESGIGCQQFPAEYSEASKRELRARVAWWENYFQTDLFSILKSSPTPEACNQSVKHTNITKLANGHIAMGMYDSLWNDIFERVTSPTPTECIDRRI